MIARVPAHSDSWAGASARGHKLRPSSGPWSHSVLDRAEAWRGCGRAVCPQKAAEAEKNAAEPSGFKLACVYKMVTGATC